MKGKCLASIMFMVFLMLFMSIVAAAARPEPGNRQMLSTNIPLDSYVYSYLDKLNGLLYLDTLFTGTKPYTRIQAAQWVKYIKETGVDDSIMPVYVQAMLSELEKEFSYELDLLNNGEVSRAFKINELTFTNSYYQGDTLTQHHTRTAYQPLNINNYGERFAENLNSLLEFQLEGGIGGYLLFGAVPQLSYDNEDNGTANFQSIYFKTRLYNLAIQIGKDAMWWGQGERGSLALTNNSTPQTVIKLNNIDPIELDGWFSFTRLKQMNVTFFCSEPEQGRTDVEEPALVGFRTDFLPSPNFTCAASLTSIVGGEGREFGLEDLWDFIFQKNDQKAGDKWDSIAGVDFRWRMPKLRGLQVYGELYGEDQVGSSFPPLFYKNAWVFGIYLPKLTATGAWDLQFEAAQTTGVWYNHHVYTDGYTYRDNIIGDAIGNKAERCYIKVGRFLADGSQLAINTEYVVMDKEAADPQEVTSLWFSYRTKLESGLILDTSVGVAAIDNFDYQVDQFKHNYLVSLGLTKKF